MTATSLWPVRLTTTGQTASAGKLSIAFSLDFSNGWNANGLLAMAKCRQPDGKSFHVFLQVAKTERAFSPPKHIEGDSLYQFVALAENAKRGDHIVLEARLENPVLREETRCDNLEISGMF